MATRTAPRAQDLMRIDMRVTVWEWMPADAESGRLGRGELASVGELLRSYGHCVAGFAPGTGFEEGP
ncbi:MAG: hypothetical protein OXH86_17175 [Acidimicrobiaceae bacterium]|nr:hypothetical protein [Acidimicrobiaceae bacterium]MDE0499075.1 hypothetical protein [Acidimicrobiaceae bacterium]